MDICDNFNKFVADKKYLPTLGEGETKASQIAVALNKLGYNWFNNGDIYDNTYYLDGWWNDLSNYANWLYGNTTKNVKDILLRIKRIEERSEYTQLLYDLFAELSNEDFLAEQNKHPKTGSVYECNGPFIFKWYKD